MCFERFKITIPEQVTVRSEDVTVATVNSMDFWVAILCNLEKAQCFQGTCCFLLLGQRVPAEAGSKLSLACHLLPLVSFLLFNPEDGGNIFS
jgi:hypothetical protein